jgi:hypothetical protein
MMVQMFCPLTIFTTVHASKDNNPDDRSHHHQSAKHIFSGNVGTNKDFGEDKVVD